MKLHTVVLAVASLLIAEVGYAEKLRGFVWEASASSIVVEGQAVRLVSETTIERPNHANITAKDLRIGWEVEIDTRGDAASGVVARKVRVKNARFAPEEVEGVVERVNGTRFFVDGDEIRLPKGTAVPPGLTPGMRFKGRGVRLDDRAIELKEGEIQPAGFVGEEAQFMAAASQEIVQVKTQLKTIKDPALQAYVDRIVRT